jgi:hypothetical protein
VRPVAGRGQDRLRRRKVAATQLAHDPGPERKIGLRVVAGVARLLESVGQRPGEIVAEPPVQPDVDAAGVAEVGVGEHPDLGQVVRLRRIVDPDGATGRVGDHVAIVRRDVQHHVVAEPCRTPKSKAMVRRSQIGP